MTHPLDERLKWLAAVDFAELEHRFERQGRNYFVSEDCRGSDPGQHEIICTHCVKADCEARVRDGAWTESWSDVFTDYERWTGANQADGYVWRTNWSLAYPGLRTAPDSAQAAEWSARLGKQMFEVTRETGRFLLRLIFHSVRSRKISDKHDTVSQVIHPL